MNSNLLDRHRPLVGCGLIAIIVALTLGAETNQANTGPGQRQFVERAKLQASDAAAGDNLGYHLALSADGKTIVGGAYAADSINGPDSGRVYVFIRSGEAWVEQARLEGSDTREGEHFGLVVALSADGNTLAAGAPSAYNPGADHSGAVFIFVRRDGHWIEQARLRADQPREGARFGSIALSRDGNTLAVGAYTDTNSAGGNAGSVYIFDRANETWTQHAHLKASDAQADAYFGVSNALSFDGNTLAVSAYSNTNSGGVFAGNVYVFVRKDGAWSEQARLQASDAAANDTFGTRISISHDGDTIAVGSYHARDATGATVGKAYVFVRSNGVWTEQAKLLASDAATADYFGSSVSLSADGCALAVGAYATDNAGLVDAGRAYLYSRDGDTWTERSRIQASDPAERDYFGQTVSLSGDATTLAVGAYGKNNSGGIDAGNVYVFSLAPDPK